MTAALKEAKGNQTHAAKLLGMSRRTLISRIEAYNLPRPRKRQPWPALDEEGDTARDALRHEPSTAPPLARDD